MRADEKDDRKRSKFRKEYDHSRARHRKRQAATPTSHQTN